MILIFLLTIVFIFLHFILEKCYNLNLLIYIFSISPQKRLIRLIILNFTLCLFFSYLLLNRYSFLYLNIVMLNIYFCYFTIFNMSLTARRINIIIEIYEKKALKINNYFNTNLAIKNRLDRLVLLGQLRKVKENYFINAYLFLFIGDVLSLIGKCVCGKLRND